MFIQEFNLYVTWDIASALFMLFYLPNDSS